MSALAAGLVVERWPRTDDELWEFVATLWGARIPREPVCHNHVPPMRAFADAFFARSPLIVWKASRGFGGKTMLMALLGLTEQVALGASVTILGGSGAQSLRLHEHMRERWEARLAPRELFATEPTQYETRLTNGGRVRALMASQGSVRGPHPQRLRLDEVDEMALPILDASLGQPMASASVPAQTVISSTHHHPDGTMTEVLRRAAERGYPVMEWCYKETLEPHGWLPAAEVARKRLELPAAMWEAEVELQEPTGGARAIDPGAVERLFAGPSLPLAPRQYLEVETPDPEGTYATGADWARKSDWTWIWTWRTDPKPWRLAAVERMQRLPWPDMVARLDGRMARYRGRGHKGAHDATGLGDVVAGYLRWKVEDVVLVGRERAEIFSEYVAAVERGELSAPRVEPAYREHLYATRDDLYGAGESAHPPDSFVAAALAYRATKAGLIPGRDVGFR